MVLAIETGRGPWVRALVAAGYRVFAVNPKQAARHRETVAVPGKKDDTFDAAALAGMVRTRRHQLREVAADSDEAEAVKMAARAHQKLVWERTRHALRMRSALREYFPAALGAYAELTLTGPDTLELARAPGPAAAARLTRAQISAALKRARLDNIAGKAHRSRPRCASSTWASPRSSRRPTRRAGPRPALVRGRAPGQRRAGR